jgi:hypothetical protein
VKVYLAGPMRGIAEFNFPAFHDATRKLRAAGYEVFSPAEHDVNNGLNVTGMKGDNAELGPSGFDLRAALAADLDYICRVADAVVVLPGWARSKGAIAEVATARAIGIPWLPLHRALDGEL